ncbi:MAG: quinone-dependent dihydroorotate dehydrogenase [Opitutus sp.]|nr:quinone-dependent dihydroorotate dehydrogenase [Opitutus sp.]
MIVRAIYKAAIKPVLFRFDPERAHHIAQQWCALAGRVPGAPALARAGLSTSDAGLRQTIAGVEFANPVGLAAGFDKNGQAVRLLGSLDFGHVEIGSVSAFPSGGNPRPRLFRAPAERAIIVNYGVPNEGAEAVAARLAASTCPVPLGVNLVKTNDAARPDSAEEVLADYASAFARLQPFASYINLNLSCPNSAKDRDFFDDPDRIGALLDRIARTPPNVPVFLKLKPARDASILRDIVGIADRHSYVAGFGINLPAGKPAELDFRMPRGHWLKYPGAVSGRPVEHFINANLRMLSEIIGPGSRYRLFAAGGVFTAEDAYRKIRLGASLVQLYTALIYEGPGIVKTILRGLSRLLHQDGFSQVSDAVGADLTGAARVGTVEKLSGVSRQE